jgi:hypothetical protein
MPVSQPIPPWLMASLAIAPHEDSMSHRRAHPLHRVVRLLSVLVTVCTWVWVLSVWGAGGLFAWHPICMSSGITGFMSYGMTVYSQDGRKSVLRIRHRNVQMAAGGNARSCSTPPEGKHQSSLVRCRIPVRGSVRDYIQQARAWQTAGINQHTCCGNA